MIVFFKLTDERFRILVFSLTFVKKNYQIISWCYIENCNLLIPYLIVMELQTPTASATAII